MLCSGQSGQSVKRSTYTNETQYTNEHFNNTIIIVTMEKNIKKKRLYRYTHATYNKIYKENI